MKKLLLLMLVLLGGFSTATADGTETTVYCAVSTTYTVKIQVKTSNEKQPIYEMEKTKYTYKGIPIYKCVYTDEYNGVDYMDFHLYDGDQWKEKKTPYSSWTTVGTYNGKLFRYSENDWVTYEPDCLKGSWDDFTSPIYFEDGVATKDITAGVSTRFKFILADTWYGAENEGATMFWDDSSDWTFKSDGGQDCYINTAVTGTYTFTLDAANKKISVRFPDYTTNEVYFYNNHSWDLTPVVYLLGSKYWDYDKGSGSYGKSGKYGYDKGHAMARVGETNVWKLEYPSTLNSQYIAIVKNREDNQGNFENTEAVYREDFNSSKPLYVPNMENPINKNFTDGDSKWTAYWNTGVWHPFPTYTRNVTSGNYGTICLPFNAIVEGADIFTISGKVMDPNDNTKVKYINLAPVEGNTMIAGKAYIFKATASELKATLSGNYSDVIVNNGMMGNITSTTPIPVSSGNLIIKDNQLREVGQNVTCGQYKAYIIPTEINTTQARGAIFMGFEDETTGIDNVNINDNFDANAPIYNLAGQRVSKSYKGVVIVNGKKMLNK